MGYTYMITCITDFIIFPIIWSAFKAYMGEGIEPWDPLTLQGAGLFHMAMGAILGVAAWSRGKEKLAGVNTFSRDIRPYSREESRYEYENQQVSSQRKPNISQKPNQEEFPEL